MEPEQTVREFFRLLALPDTKAAVALLDDEVVWRNTGLPTIKGRRVGGMLLDTEKRGVTVDITVHHSAATGAVVLTDRTDVLRKGKWQTSFWVRGTFEVHDGKITLWDDAFSWLDFTRGSLVGLTRLFS
ncbi:MAG: limonene,2-epoxide hydrolase [Nocardioidaceae bacterium]|jgi:limonene-1,2-epoxide hydrolase|nr:limonene,2-epoxide hydrolase [Nocardioidaceae bacterium]